MMSGQANWDGKLFTTGKEIIERKGTGAGFRQAVVELYSRQCEDWPELGEAAAALDRLRTRDVVLDGRTLRLQNNPARIRNVNAPTGAKDVARRPCPICPHHMPQQQQALPFMDDWMVVCNPLPLFKQHLVLVWREHTRQSAERIIPAMLEFSRLTGFITHYNGPRCGASIPDHLHIQASPPGWLPLEEQVPDMQGRDTLVDYLLPCRIFLAAGDLARAEKLFGRTLKALEPFKMDSEDYEPGMNIAVVPGSGSRPPLVVVHPRSRHRPACFYTTGDEHYVISPGSVDMAGLAIVPRPEDFERLDDEKIHSIYAEVCLDPENLATVERQL